MANEPSSERPPYSNLTVQIRASLRAAGVAESQLEGYTSRALAMIANGEAADPEGAVLRLLSSKER
ncbi:MAG TPA: hypothetical protein VLA88_06200 [Candidatus Saccharimonadales bacterium]|nr:hypothetical protein [Candidatus Saccharimonadales bacterium]